MVFIKNSRQECLLSWSKTDIPVCSAGRQILKWLECRVARVLRSLRKAFRPGHPTAPCAGADRERDVALTAIYCFGIDRSNFLPRPFQKKTLRASARGVISISAIIDCKSWRASAFSPRSMRRWASEYRASG